MRSISSFENLLETCGEGKEYRTRGPTVRASNGGQDCEGKSYQLGGQVRDSLYQLFDQNYL